MEKEWYSLQEIEDLTGIKKSTLSRDVDEFRIYIENKKFWSKRLVKSTSIPVIKKIRDYYAQGLNTKEIHLKLQGSPTVIDVKNEDDLLHELQTMKKEFQGDIQILKEGLKGELREEFKEMLLQQQSFIDERLREWEISREKVELSVKNQKQAMLEASATVSKKEKTKLPPKKKWWQF